MNTIYLQNANLWPYLLTKWKTYMKLFKIKYMYTYDTPNYTVDMKSNTEYMCVSYIPSSVTRVKGTVVCSYQYHRALRSNSFSILCAQIQPPEANRK